MRARGYLEHACIPTSARSTGFAVFAGFACSAGYANFADFAGFAEFTDIAEFTGSAGFALASLWFLQASHRLRRPFRHHRLCRLRTGFIGFAGFVGFALVS